MGSIENHCNEGCWRIVLFIAFFDRLECVTALLQRFRDILLVHRPYTIPNAYTPTAPTATYWQHDSPLLLDVLSLDPVSNTGWL